MEKVRLGVQIVLAFALLVFTGFVQYVWNEMKHGLLDRDPLVSDGWLFSLVPILLMLFTLIVANFHFRFAYKKVFGVSFNENKDARQLTVQQLQLMHEKAEEGDVEK